MALRTAILTRLQARKLGSAIAPDETVLFFPTAASRRPGGAWHVPIHGWIYQPTELSRLRRLSFHICRRLVAMRYRGIDLSSPIFRERVGAFLADNERGNRIEIELGEARFQLKKSRADGHFEGSILLPGELLRNLVAAPRTPRDWLTFRAVMRSADPRRFDGRVLLLPRRGLSVISDIDDTIKITEVLDRRRLLRNTFLKEFQPVPEMAALYRRWETEREVAFHYVSASPWHLYPFLSDFLAAQGFPAGTFHLRDFRLVPGSLRTVVRPSRRVKERHIRSLLQRFPQRRFLLVGDSGESDPELYAAVARQFPRQVAAIYIRNITGESPASPRFSRAFRALPGSLWQLFEDPADLP